MLFNSFAFLIFLPIVLVGYYLLGHRAQNRFLLAASLFFYGCWDWRFLGLLLPLMLIDFQVAATLEKMRLAGATLRRQHQLVAISMGCNLAALAFFKYCDFFVANLASLLTSTGFDVSLPVLNIVLPIGISFFTFQSMSYTIDVYRGEIKATRNFLDFALFVSFFPHLVAGPIMKAHVLLPQVLKPRKILLDVWLSGLQLIVWGMWKKIFVADSLAPTVDRIFNTAAPTGFETLVGVLAFAFQIYGDFSGYTDIARGVARLMGFELGYNFKLPYFARNPQEFWNRWHISLSTWLRSYLYIPLGGNRGGNFKTYRNLLLTMLLGGLWHGAAWNFVLWGAYQGLMLCVHRAFITFRGGDAAARIPAATSRAVLIAIMFCFTCYGWLLFRASSFEQIAQMSRALLHPLDAVDWPLLKSILIYIAPLYLIELYQYCARQEFFLDSAWLPQWSRTAAYGVLFYCMLFHAAAPQAFVYFQF